MENICEFCKLEVEKDDKGIEDEKGRGWHSKCLMLLASLWKSPMYSKGEMAVTLVKYEGNEVGDISLNSVPEEHLPRIIRVLLGARVAREIQMKAEEAKEEEARNGLS
jgi:hypothetical protein